MKIIKDKMVKNVTKGAYEQFYKPLGYEPLIVINAEVVEEVHVEPKQETVSTNVDIKKKTTTTKKSASTKKSSSTNRRVKK